MDKWQSRKKEETMQQFKPTSTWEKKDHLAWNHLPWKAQFYLLWVLEPTELTREAKRGNLRMHLNTTIYLKDKNASTFTSSEKSGSKMF